MRKARCLEEKEMFWLKNFWNFHAKLKNKSASEKGKYMRLDK